jgi:hypothetical protein
MTSSTSLIISGSSDRIHRQCARDRHALLLAAGQFGRIFLRLNLETDAIEQFRALRDGFRM